MTFLFLLHRLPLQVVTIIAAFFTFKLDNLCLAKLCNSIQSSFVVVDLSETFAGHNLARISKWAWHLKASPIHHVRRMRRRLRRVRRSCTATIFTITANSTALLAMPPATPFSFWWTTQTSWWTQIYLPRRRTPCFIVCFSRRPRSQSPTRKVNMLLRVSRPPSLVPFW